MKTRCLSSSPVRVFSTLSVVDYAVTSDKCLFKTIFIFESVILSIMCLTTLKSQMMIILYGGIVHPDFGPVPLVYSYFGSENK